MGLLVPSYAQGFARSAAEAAEPHRWDKLGALFVPMLGQTGQNTLVDWSGRGQDATLRPAAIWSQKPEGPNVVTTTGGIVLPKPLLSSANTNAFTVAMSFYRSAQGSGNRLFDQQTTRTVLWITGPTNNQELHTYIGGLTLDVDPVPIDARWREIHQVVWSETQNPDTQRVWWDGLVRLDTAAVRPNWGVGADATKIGEDSITSTEFLTGGVLFFAYYNRAWTDVEAREFCQDPYRMLRPVRRVAELQLVPPTVRPWWYWEMMARQ